MTAARSTAAAHTGVYASPRALIGRFTDAFSVAAAFSAVGVATAERTATAAAPVMTVEES
jgi:hypothetical protein